MPGTFGDDVNARGWRCGAVIAPDMVDAARPFLHHAGHASVQLEDGAWLALLSQSCDVVQAKLEAEPFVEILHCHPIPALRTQFKQRKSTRQLDFKPNTATHPDLCLTAHAIADRFHIPRQLLQQHNPDAARRLSDTAIRNIQAWYALRYSRPALPQKYVNRIAPVLNSLRQILEPLNEEVDEVRFSISSRDDLPDNEDYLVAIFFIVPEKTWSEEPEARQRVARASSAFISALKGCNGISVDEDVSGSYGGADFSWEMASRSEAWNFANLSPIE